MYATVTGYNRLTKAQAIAYLLDGGVVTCFEDKTDSKKLPTENGARYATIAAYYPQTVVTLTLYRLVGYEVIRDTLEQLEFPVAWSLAQAWVR